MNEDGSVDIRAVVEIPQGRILYQNFLSAFNPFFSFSLKQGHPRERISYGIFYVFFYHSTLACTVFALKI
jgi:hypothetical protein